MNVGCTGTHQETGRPRLGQALAAASRRGPLPSSCACFVAAHRPMNRLKRKRGQDARGWRQPLDSGRAQARLLFAFNFVFASAELSELGGKTARRCPRGRSERAPRAHSRWAGGAHTREARAGTGMRAAGRAALRLLGQGRGVEAEGRRLQAGSASTSGGAASSWLRWSWTPCTLTPSTTGATARPALLR